MNEDYYGNLDRPSTSRVRRRLIPANEVHPSLAGNAARTTRTRKVADEDNKQNEQHDESFARRSKRESSNTAATDTTTTRHQSSSQNPPNSWPAAPPPYYVYNYPNVANGPVFGLGPYSYYPTLAPPGHGHSAPLAPVSLATNVAVTAAGPATAPLPQLQPPAPSTSATTTADPAISFAPAYTPDQKELIAQLFQRGQLTFAGSSSSVNDTIKAYQQQNQQLVWIIAFLLLLVLIMVILLCYVSSRRAAVVSAAPREVVYVRGGER